MNDMNTAIAHYQKGDYGQAITHFLKAAKAGDPMGYYNAGVCYQDQELYDQAIDLFEKAIPSGSHLALYNIGVCYEDQRLYHQALTYYDRALIINPDYAPTSCNIAYCLNELGRGDEAIAPIEKAFALDPAHPAISPNILAILCSPQPMESWPVIAQRILDHQQTPMDHKFLASVYAGCASWCMDQTHRPNPFPDPDPSYSWARNMKVYRNYVQLLAQQKDKELYQQGETITLIGDSHVLSYAGLQYKGKSIASQLVMGSKAFHLASKKHNKYIATFKAHLACQKPGDEILISAGEIDCRMNEGILPYQQKTGRPLADIVTQQVAHYAKAMQQIAPNLKVTFINIPAPTKENGDRRDVIKLFNTELAKHGNVIDLYSCTLAEGGYAKEGCHIDGIHLKPGVFVEALK